jgi:ornithine decarboxylase
MKSSSSSITSNVHEVLPSSVHGLVDCARHEIRSLLHQVESPTADTYINDDSIEDALDDGFMICDLQVVQNKLDAWLRLFPRVKPCFALKCNPDVQVAQVLGNSGQAGFDCASLSELLLAKQVTTNPGNGSTNNDKSSLGLEHVVYANPQRAEQDLQVALSKEMGVRALTFDGAQELHKIHAAWQKLELDNDDQLSSPLQLILRILVPDLHSSIPLGEKFGAPLTHVPELAQLAQTLHLPIIGISFHCGSGCHNPEAYAQALRLARQAMDDVDQVQMRMTTATTLPFKCWLLDMGGGYPGWDGNGGDVGRFSGRCLSENHHPTSTFESEKIPEATVDIAKVVVPILDELFPADQYTRISEPGRYFVEAAFMLASRIYKVGVVDVDDDDKTTQCRQHYTIGHGVQGVFKDVVLCGESFLPIPLRHSMVLLEEEQGQQEENININTTTAPQQQQQQGQLLKTSVVYGPSGEDYDIVCADCQLPELQVGDWLLFDRMGAYTLSIASRTGRPITRYVQGGSSAKK